VAKRKVTATEAADAFAEAGEARRASPKSLAKLKALGDERDMLIAKKKELEEQTTVINTRIAELDFSLIPKAMKEGGMLEYMRDDGTKVKRDLIINGSFPKKGTPERTKAEAYLRKSDAEELFQTTISIPFGKGEDKAARTLYNDLRKKNNSLEITLDSDINTGSLKSWAKERLENGKKVDTELLGLKTANGVKYIAPRGGAKK
jgi:hypothetical protein